MRLLAGLHYLVLGGGVSWDDVDAVLDSRADWLAQFAATQPVQTNEVGRAWALLPGLLSVGAEHIDLVELGASAGLLLCLDRFGYRYREGDWGHGRPVLGGVDRAGPPAALLERGLEVVRRRGVDQRLVDASTGDGARLLQAFLWPGEDERVERLREALETLREDPPELIAGDYVDLVPEVLADKRDDATTVVFTSVTTMYLADERYDELVRQLAGVTWLSLEAPRHDREYDGMRLVLDGRVLAEHIDFHGMRMEWCA